MLRFFRNNFFLNIGAFTSVFEACTFAGQGPRPILVPINQPSVIHGNRVDRKPMPGEDNQEILLQKTIKSLCCSACWISGKFFLRLKRKFSWGVLSTPLSRGIHDQSIKIIVIMLDHDTWPFGSFLVSIVNAISNNCKCLASKSSVLKVITTKHKTKLLWVIKNMYSIKIWSYSTHGPKSQSFVKLSDNP